MVIPEYPPGCGIESRQNNWSQTLVSHIGVHSYSYLPHSSWPIVVVTVPKLLRSARRSGIAFA